MVGYPEKTLEQQTIEQKKKRLLPSFFSWIKGGNIVALGRPHRIGLPPTGIKEYTHKVKKRT